MIEIVTGAFGYIGRAITERLLELGRPVRTITTHPDKPNPFGSDVEAAPLEFDRPERLEAALHGGNTLYNTYWVRFEYAETTFREAVARTAILFACARRAGIGKIVHISVTHASIESHLPYYRGKAMQELALAGCGVPYAIVRPTFVFGRGDILVNNMAWLLRTFPVFPIFGSGAYRLQPVYVGDLAQIAVEAAEQPSPWTVDAAGPEIFSFEALIAMLAKQIRPGVRRIHVPPWLGLAAGRIVGEAVGDVILTRDELRGLMDELLLSEGAPKGSTSFSAWLRAHGRELGANYASELRRHFAWKPPAVARR